MTYKDSGIGHQSRNSFARKLITLKPLKLALSTALLVSGASALAVPFNSFDPRSMAMGGAGVAVGDAATAPFFNPALLSVAKDTDKFSVNFPIVGGRVYDPSDFSSSIDSFQKGNYVNNLTNSLAAFNSTPSNQNLTAVTSDISALNGKLITLDNKPIQGEIGGAMVVGIPSKKFGGAFFADGWGAAGGVISYKDSQTLTDLSAAITCASTAANACNSNPYYNTGTHQVTFNANTNLQSSVNIRGVVMGETGVALAREFTFRDQTVSIGITPKLVKTELFDYTANVNTANSSQSNAKGSDYTSKYNSFNFDLGLAKNYNNGWRAGLVVKNLIPHTYDFKNATSPGASTFVTTGQMRLKPQARIGASHENSWSTVAMDLDLTRNDPAGLENKSQYLALGAELNAWNWAQLRAGYRADLVTSARSVASLGLGLAPFGKLHADVTVAGNAHEIGASMQLGFHW